MNRRLRAKDFMDFDDLEIEVVKAYDSEQFFPIQGNMGIF